MLGAEVQGSAQFLKCITGDREENTIGRLDLTEGALLGIIDIVRHDVGLRLTTATSRKHRVAVRPTKRERERKGWGREEDSTTASLYYASSTHSGRRLLELPNAVQPEMLDGTLHETGERAGFA